MMGSYYKLPTGYYFTTTKNRNTFANIATQDKRHISRMLLTQINQVNY